MPVNASQTVRPNSPAIDEAGPNRKDKGYRRYASNVERALSLFDTALQEWADYIAFLGRLLKALHSKPSGTTDVPYKALVAKRLAQCLDPTLPSGVHQKALEVYAYVFSTLNRDGLSRDLPLYLPGLAPTLSFASLSVKPTLLSLFETFILPLDPVMLRSALKAITLALLPGLEEETSEEFERTLSLLNKFRSRVGQGLESHAGHSNVSGDQYYWQSLFLASITSPTRRQGALAYMVRELPLLGDFTKPNSESSHGEETDTKGIGRKLLPQNEAVTTPEPGLLIRCFAAGLQDEQLLIQRGFLDLLVTHLPLHSAVLRLKVVSRDLELLVAAAAAVVVRREMSLNRRLWTWFLGPEASSRPDDSTPNSPDSSPTVTPANKYNLQLSQAEYFERYGLTPLVSSVLKIVMDDSLKPPEKARPFRICLSLMDRWEIGGLVVPQVFLPAMESLWRYQGLAPSKEALEEVLRSANVFFDAIESSLIWAELIKIIIGALSTKDPKPQEADSLSPQDRLDLVLFVIRSFNVREEEMLAIHIPMATLAMIISLRRRLEASPNDAKDNLSPAMDIAIHLFDIIPAKFLGKGEEHRPKTRGNGQSQDISPQILQAIQDFYHNLQRGSEDAVPPFDNSDIRDLLLHNATRIVTHGLGTPVQAAYLDKEVAFLDKLLRKAQISRLEDDEEAENGILIPIVSSLSTALEAGAARIGMEDLPFPTLAVMVSALEMMGNASPTKAWNANHRVRQILPSLLTGLWTYISPARPENSVEAVRCLWRVHSVSPDVRLVEGSIATLMLQDENGHRSQNVKIEGARRFATLWAHSGSAMKTPADSRLNSGRTLHQSGIRNKEPILLAQPLLLLLDSLFDPKTELFMFTVSWLQSLTSIQLIVEFLIYRLDASPYLLHERSSATPTDGQEKWDGTGASLRIDDCLYYIQTILNITKHSAANISASLAGKLSDTKLNRDQRTGEAEISGPVKVLVDADEPAMTIQSYLTQVCVRILEDRHQQQSSGVRHRISILRQTSASLLKQLLLSPSSTMLAAMNLEDSLIGMLSWSVEQSDHMLQLPLMDVILIILRTRMTKNDVLSTAHRRPTSRDTIRSASQLSVSTEKSDRDNVSIEPSIQTSALLDCLTFGIGSPNNQPILEQWIRFLDNCLPFYSGNIFQVLMPLVDTFSRSIDSVFQDLQAVFAGTSRGPHSAGEPVTVLNALVNGLEQVLARGHDQLLQDEGHPLVTKSPEQVQGFFGNMVSGVFTSEAQKSRPTTANIRLTVLLCFKDAVRVSFNMWSWGDGRSESSPHDAAVSASFSYMSIRLRNRARRILEHLFAAEALECLETLVEFWHKAGSEGGMAQSSTVFNLLHALEAARPKNTIPALFNAMYSRTNPNVLDPIRKSTLTSELSDINLAMFLVAYTRSMEDDALDEIWTDCMTFLRDVVGNPLPHRQTLPILLEFTAILGEKIDNTNFGEQRRMRRDIGDLFVRLLAATFTIKPLAFSQDLPFSTKEEKGLHHPSVSPETSRLNDPEDVVRIIASILPNISKILVDTDRITAATLTISTQVLTPTFRWKTFPRNVTGNLLGIMRTMSRIPEASKSWRKDVAEAFNDPRFFHTNSLDLVWNGWMPILRQWTFLDKDRMPELLSRLSSPTSAGIMFGVGASSARLEADRKTQLNLRRIATLMLSADNDMFVVNIGGLQEKVVDLMTATAASSPSSITRSEVYMVLRALILKTSPVHLAPFWPIVNAELYDALSSLYPTETHDTYNISCVLQAAKLLDTLLTLAPDDFQLREWLFVTDTIDAVYRPSDWRPVALVDGLAETLDSRAGAPHSGINHLVGAQQGLRKPLLTCAVVGDIPMESMVDRVIRPFLRQLSINAFESTYRMEAPDRQACCDDLLHDLFDESTLV